MTTDHLTHDRPRRRARPVASKVPEVTVWFWIIKVLTTGMGETASDLLAHVLGPIPAVALGAAALAAALAVQLAVRRYVAWIYWTAIVMVSVFGTMAADVLHVGLGVPYLLSTPCFLAALAAVLVLWHRAEGTLSIHSVHTRRRELFYWAAVLATFALGTAAGDLTATAGLGYLGSAVGYAAAIAVPAVAHRWGNLNAVAAFWGAYVITRPLGASVADWMAADHARGGLALGLAPVTLSWTLAILTLIAYLTLSRRDTPHAAPA
ncbi:hypothetical protein [Streptomyces sp. NPDC087212]|uniref:COG4705 family protein n=1 Tax=Streptomyces sp. NPDC087212 TaxID=3365766 RepID=UPI0038067FAD